MNKLHWLQNYVIILIKGFSFDNSNRSDTQTDMLEERRKLDLSIWWTLQPIQKYFTELIFRILN